MKNTSKSLLISKIENLDKNQMKSIGDEVWWKKVIWGPTREACVKWVEGVRELFNSGAC